MSIDKTQKPENIRSAFKRKNLKYGQNTFMIRKNYTID